MRTCPFFLPHNVLSQHLGPLLLAILPMCLFLASSQVSKVKVKSRDINFSFIHGIKKGYIIKCHYLDMLGII